MGTALAARLRRLLGRASAPPAGAAAPEPAAPPPQPRTEAIHSQGAVVRDSEVAHLYRGAVTLTTPTLRISAKRVEGETTLVAFEAGRVALTTIYLPIDVDHHRLFINQTYEGVLHFWGCRARIEGDRYSFDAAAAEVIDRRAVVIGGPIDGNYYHWMLNWLARLATLRLLRPDLLADPGVGFVMHDLARGSPYIDFLQAIGLGEERLIWVHHAQDYLVTQAILVSFGSQHVFAPAVVESLREMFAPVALAAPPGPRPRRIFISRQDLPGPIRRRIVNIAPVRAVLDAFGVEEVTLEGRPIAEQIALFQEADFIGSVHGAGLTNIVFCRAACQVLALDSTLHALAGAAAIYARLAETRGLPYRSLRVRLAPRPPGVERNAANMHNQDILVAPAKLYVALEAMLGPPLKPWAGAAAA